MNNEKAMFELLNALGLPVDRSSLSKLMKGNSVFDDYYKKRAQRSRLEVEQFTENKDHKKEIEELDKELDGIMETISMLDGGMSKLGAAAPALAGAVIALKIGIEAANNALERTENTLSNYSEYVGEYGSAFSISDANYTKMINKQAENDRKLAAIDAYNGKYGGGSALKKILTDIKGGILDAKMWIHGIKNDTDILSNVPDYLKDYIKDTEQAGILTNAQSDILAQGFNAHTARLQSVLIADLVNNSGIYSKLGKTDENFANIYSEYLDLILNGGTGKISGFSVSDDIMAAYAYNAGLNWNFMSEQEQMSLRANYLRQQVETGLTDELTEQNRLYAEQGNLINQNKETLLAFDQANVLNNKNSVIPTAEEFADIFSAPETELKNLFGDIESSAKHAANNISETFNKGTQNMVQHFNSLSEAAAYGKANGINNNNKNGPSLAEVMGANGGSKAINVNDILKRIPTPTLKSIDDIDINDTNGSSVLLDQRHKPDIFGSQVPKHGVLDTIKALFVGHYADGGMTMSEHLAVVGDNRSGHEVILPLDSGGTISALSQAMSLAGARGGGNTTVNLTIDGPTFFDSEASMNKLADKIEDTINLRNQKGG